jgi:hypothetical protein
VSEGERLSWLVLGRAPTDATKADLGMLQAAAGALLSRGESMPIDRRMARAVGLDEVSFRGSGELQDSVVAFGKRLSDRVYISYEQGLGAIPTNLVKLDYSLSRRWSLRGDQHRERQGAFTASPGTEAAREAEASPAARRRRTSATERHGFAAKLRTGTPCWRASVSTYSCEPRTSSASASSAMR